MTRKFPRVGPVLLAAAVLCGCGTNPVTGKRELQIVSEGQEVQMGQQNYVPSRQMQGGDFVLDPGLTTYVNEVGQRLGAVSDRQLPYEFVVLNNPVPNAWALPGGKIAVNRGLLTELNSEAELAAVLGHEITHAAARHGAKSVERGMLLQGALLATQIAAHEHQYGSLLVGGASVAAQLLSTKYGRDAELEADSYGMGYMKRAGYDPAAAVDLQKTFVRLSEGKRSNWLEGLFASHPPSEARVAANEKKAAELGVGGEIDREAYQQKLAPLRKALPAYKKYEEGVAALRKGDNATAMRLGKEAAQMEPREGKFYELQGDAYLEQREFARALDLYDQSLQRNPNYFKPHLQSGIARYEMGDRSESKRHFERSWELLPTAPAAFYLGRLAQAGGDNETAIKYFEAAASSDSDVGKASARELVRLDLPRNPGKYLAIEPRVDKQGRVWLLVQNRAPVPISGVTIAAGVANAQGGFAQGPIRVTTGRDVIGPGQVAQVATSLGPLANAEALRAVRFEVQGASIAE